MICVYEKIFMYIYIYMGLGVYLIVFLSGIAVLSSKKHNMLANVGQAFATKKRQL